MTKEQQVSFEFVKEILLTGSEITTNEMEFLKRNKELFTNFRFKKVRRADPKWRMLR